MGPIDLPHPAFANLRDDVVRAKARADGKGQSVVVEYTGRAVTNGDYLDQPTECSAEPHWGVGTHPLIDTSEQNRLRSGFGHCPAESITSHDIDERFAENLASRRNSDVHATGAARPTISYGSRDPELSAIRKYGPRRRPAPG